MGQHIESAGFAIPAVRLVEYSEERVFDSSEKLLAYITVDVREGVEGKCRRVV